MKAFSPLACVRSLIAIMTMYSVVFIPNVVNANTTDQATTNATAMPIAVDNTGGSKGSALVNLNALTELSQQKAMAFSAQLKAELLSAIRSGGLEAGIKVCHTKAPEIANGLSNDGWVVGRTSIRTRNSQNIADDWELKQLQDFDARFKKGESPSSLISVSSEGDRFRFMKAIPTGQLCLACHGSSIDPKLEQNIVKLYPNDRAVGFTIEDIRGAFILEKDMSTY